MSATGQQVPGLKRTDLQEHDLSVPGRVVIQNRVELGGDALMVPPDTVHPVRNVGSGGAALLSTYVVEKGKPFLVLVD